MNEYLILVDKKDRQWGQIVKAHGASIG